MRLTPRISDLRYCFATLGSLYAPSSTAIGECTVSVGQKVRRVDDRLAVCRTCQDRHGVRNPQKRRREKKNEVRSPFLSRETEHEMKCAAACQIKNNSLGV